MLNEAGWRKRLADITSAVPGSFAWRVLQQRHPALIEQVRTAHPYGPERQTALNLLLEEIEDGRIQPLPPDAHDGAAWEQWGSDYFGRQWIDIPFLWAESYFYRKLLEAVGFFTPGAWFRIDPFEPMRTAELADPPLEADLAALGRLRFRSDRARTCALLLASLWGNRADLGFRIANAVEAAADTMSSLVVDDGAVVLSALEAGAAKTLCLIADNAGRELLSDLLLVDHLLQTGLTDKVFFHIKPYPYYVSDAMTGDVIACLRRLAATDDTNDVAGRLRLAMSKGRMTLYTHEFYCAPLSFHHMPPDLFHQFTSASMTLVKGDLNYRRLVGDWVWPVAAPFAEAVGYFPGSVVALRTLKSEVVVGIDVGLAARLDDSDRDWRTNGQRGLIQSRLL